jgi:hypothetical protein
VHLLALDWKKAFDSINSESMLRALRIFGLPEHFIALVQSIYTDRKFQVSENGVKSSQHSQGSGICQGCPLSPYLYIIVMTILMDQARGFLSPEAVAAISSQQMFDIVYADDTMILGASGRYVEEYAAAVEKAGTSFGMSLHWGKTQALAVCSDETLSSPQGERIADNGSLIYLGGLLKADGRADSEVSRRIGLASGDFRNLARCWAHAGVSRKRKLELFNSLVASKLQYGLSTLWLVTAQRRRLDGFHARCLRRVLGIPAAFVSRISNKDVFAKGETMPMSEQILQRQGNLLGKIAASPVSSPLRSCTFVGTSLQPRVGRFVRRIGRPRQDWTSEVLKAAEQRLGKNAKSET